MLFICLTSANEYSGADESREFETYLAKIAQDDSAALAGLYQKTSMGIYSFAFSILKNRQDAEDVLHDSYLSIYSAAASYRPEGKPMAWMITIARNHCLQKLRSQNKITDISEEDWENHLPDTNCVPTEERLVLAACMKLLSDEERQIVVLHVVSGMKHREIAEAFSIPLPTVLSKYHRALKKLKNFMKQGELKA